MGKFEKRFFTVLEQDEALPTPDAQAAASTLEPETNPDDLGANVDDQAVKAIAAREKQMVDSVNRWVDELGRFTQYLNGRDSNSMLSILSKAEADTLLDKIKTTETKRITRTAAELASLQQTLLGYLGTANNPKYKYV